jgi:hypothetical protein
MQRLKLIEQTSGDGRLKGLHGEIPVTYSLVVTERVPLMHGGALKGVQARASGSDSGIPFLWQAFQQKTPLDLVLEDGRTFPCLLHKIDGASVLLVARGDFA